MGRRDMTGARHRVVIVGNGMAGAKLADELAQAERFAVTVIGAEREAAYNRIMLSAVLAGDVAATDIRLATRPGVERRLGAGVASIDRAAKQVHTANGDSVAYDTLVLATGSRPVVLPIPGTDLSGVLTFRDLADVDAMLAVPRGAKAVVIGGGLLGLEAAEGLRRRGLDVTVVHLMPWLMERQLDRRAAALLQQELETRGIRVVLPVETAAILGDKCATGVALKDGRKLPADLVVMAVGIRPDTALARAAQLECGRGIVVDDAMRSSDPAIHAIGECCEHRGTCHGLVAPIWEQVAACAAVLQGERTRFAAGPVATSLKVSSVALYSAGELAAGVGAEEIVLEDGARGTYRKLVLRDGKLAGAVLFGDAGDGPWFFELMRAGRDVRAMRGDLIFGPAFAPAPVPSRGFSAGLAEAAA
jgi:nitrite reductase (NADH) large subunit